MGGAAAAVGLIAGVGGSLLQAKSAIDAGNAEYKAGMLNAQLARQEGYAEETRRRREMRRELSSEAVAYAKAGVSTTEGSPLELLAQNAQELERDALDARLQGLRGYSVARKQANQAYKASRKQALAAVLSGVSGAVGTGYKMRGGG
jgi:hypothetical protein